jgi:hypothetical protein
MTVLDLPQEFVEKCKSVTAKRPRTVIDHILAYGYLAFPEDYDHVAMLQARRADIMWIGPEIGVYDRLKKRTMELQKDIPEFIKEIVEKHV